MTRAQPERDGPHTAQRDELASSAARTVAAPVLPAFVSRSTHRSSSWAWRGRAGIRLWRALRRACSIHVATFLRSLWLLIHSNLARLNASRRFPPMDCDNREVG